MYREIKYRKVKKKDISQITNLFKKTFNKKISKEFYDWRYKKKNTYNSYIALENNKVIAHIGYVEYRFFINKKVYSRHSSFVDKKFRRKNIYTNLLKFSFSKLKKNCNFILAWPNQLNIKNNLKSKNFFLIQRYDLFKSNFKENKIIKLKKFTFNKLKFKNKSLNSLFIKDKKYIKWRFFSYKKENYFKLDIDTNKKQSVILQKNKYRKKLFYNIADYFEDNKVLEKAIFLLNNLKVNYQFLIPSNDKKFKSKLIKYNCDKDEYVFNVGIYVLKQNDKLKEILINKIKKNIKIADTDVFIQTF